MMWERELEDMESSVEIREERNYDNEDINLEESNYYGFDYVIDDYLESINTLMELSAIGEDISGILGIINERGDKICNLINNSSKLSLSEKDELINKLDVNNKNKSR